MRYIAGAMLALALAGCGNGNTENSGTMVSLTTLGLKMDAAERNVLDLQTRVQQLERPAAVLKRSDDGFSVIDTDVGPMTVQLSSVTKDGPGSKATLQIGNPSSATVTSFTIDFTAGPSDKDGNPDNASAKRAVVKKSTILGRGAWTNVVVPIEDMPSDKVSYIAIRSIGVGSMKLDAPD